MLDEPPKPLPGDPQRQASGTILAYSFQLWRTVLVWLQLGPNDRLWIEQAEDFDVTSASAATAVQVSHSRRKVTLRDGKLRDAIFHCWELQQRSGQPRFQFRYITRGEATVEAGEPFGANTAGLKLWPSASSDPAVAGKLLDFLRDGRAHFPPLFAAFLEKASPADAVKSLFAPLVFELGSGDTSVVQDAVNVQLAAFAEQNGMMPAAVIRARDALFQRVVATAGQPKERWLTRAHLHAALAGSASVVMRADFEVFMRTVEELEPSLRALAAIATGSDAFIEAPLPLPPDCIVRPEVLSALRAKLRPGRIIFAQASTGMGKTTLAKMLAAGEPGVWKWVSMAGLRGEAVVQRLRALSARLARETGTLHILLDEVDVSAGAHAQLGHTLAVLAIALAQRGGQLFVTTQNEPSSRVIEVCGGDADSVFSVPRMSYQEIREIARLLGCPEGYTREGWANIARLSSQGHPQLARAVLLDAKARSWPSPSLLDQTTDESVGHVKSEARRLVGNLPEPQKDLLYRLSLVTGRFRREHALSIGAWPPPLERPGEAFDPLVGAWIEPMSDKSFRVSPLLADAAKEVFAGERLRELHVSISRAFAEGKMSPQEGAQAFEHAWEAKLIPALRGMVESLFSESRAVFDAVSAHVSWFIAEGLKEGEVLLPENQHVSLLLRMFLVRIAAGNLPALAVPALRAWRAEIEQGEPRARPSARYLLAIEALGQGEIVLSAKDTVDYLGMLFDLEASDADLRAVADEGMARVPPNLAREMPHESLAGLQVVLSFNRSRSVAWLDDWLTALEAASPALREKILHAARLNPWWCGMMIDAAWLAEEAKPQPDWPCCLAVLGRASQLGAQWNVEPWVFAAVRATTVIRDEYQHDAVAALRGLDTFLAATAKPHPRLLDARAAVLFNRGDYSAAVAAWDDLLTTWVPETDHDRYPAFGARTRAIALARLGDFRGAAEGFADARRRLPTGDDTPQAAGLLADAGLCWWKAGDFAAAFAALNEAAQAADVLPSGHADLLAFRMRRMVGHVVMRIHSRLTGWTVEGQGEPQPGMASDLTTPDALKELPETTFEYTWALLDRLANLFGLDERIPVDVQTKLAQSPLLPVRFLIKQTEIERALRLGKVEGLPALAENIEHEFALGVHFARTVTTGQISPPPAPPTGWQPNSDVSGAKLFSAALVVTCARGAADKIVNEWRNAPTAKKWGSAFTEWLDHVEEMLAMPLPEAAARLRDPEHLSASDGLLLAARVASDADVAPADSLRSQVQLVLALAPGFWRVAVGHCLAQLSEQTWRRHTANTALLRSPRLTVPRILEACTKPRLGVAKAAAIIITASEATGPRISPEIREQLQKLSNDDLPFVRSQNPFPSPKAE